MGRPKIEIQTTAIRQIQALSGFGLPLKAIASFLEISKSTLKRWKQDDRVSHAFAIGQIRAELAIGEALLKQATKQGDIRAIIWWEKTRAGRTERGIQAEVGARVEIELQKVFKAAKEVLK
jgi:uncharacterized protein YjcR